MIFFYIQLVYGQFPRTTSTWCTHDVSLTYVNCAFNLFVDGEHKRLVVAVREISLRQSYEYLSGSLSDHEVQLQRTFSDLAWKPWWLLCMSNSHCSCLREAYVLPNRKMHLRFSQDFHLYSPVDNPYKHVQPADREKCH